MKAKIMLFTILLTGLVAANPAFAQGDGKLHVTDKRVVVFQKQLEQQGFKVTHWEDAFGPVNLACWVCNGLTDTAFGNNAAAPYQVISEPYEGVRVGREMQLEPYDAVIFIGKTPPPVAYFSYTGFVYSRYNGDGKDRKQIFSSIGDTINHSRINTIDKKHPFDKDVIIVMTADQGTNASVLNAAMRAGFPQSIMNTMVVPSSVVKLGKDEKADTLIFVERMYLPANQDDLNNYMDTSSQWASVLYVTYPEKPAKLDPYPTPQMLVRGTGKTETDLMPALDRLESEIVTANPGYQAEKLQSGIWLLEWLDGFQRGTNLIGECRDTVYLKTADFKLGSNPEDFLVVFGVNHEATGKATYSNFTLYHAAMELGLAGKNSREIIGTVDRYDLGKYQAMSKQLYAFKVARDCGGLPATDCLEVKQIPVGNCPFGDCCPRGSLDDDLFLGFRAYVEPETGVGPYWFEILWDRAIHFKK
ncbi:hypothetical protein [Geomonas ferrireducens]|uniref:hypothetical protein n=1 Tax=Geomonas ferrireducens TaxID=2570227 RepID=UPI0010A81257|nr:hypothetical protein [Geomonas ferrireducens]